MTKTPPPAQAGLPMTNTGLPTTNTVDAGTALQHEQQRIEHERRMREAEAQRVAAVIAAAEAEVNSWPEPRSYAPRPAPEPAQQQRIPVSFEPQNADEMWRYAQMLARSSLLPKSFYAKGDWDKTNARIADVHFVLMKGHALGLHPQVSISNINVIEGKAEVGALLMVALIRRSGLCRSWTLKHSDDRSATYSTHRIGEEEAVSFTYTIEEAEQMGLLDKGKTEEAKAKNQWRLQPRTMLRRRCQSMLAREIYPDICMGLYDHGELSELREREIALGIDPDKVIPMNGLPAGDQQSLPEPTGPGPIARAAAQPTDPLKARLTARRAAATTVIAPRRCSMCDSILDPRDNDPCIACSADMEPPVSTRSPT